MVGLVLNWNSFRYYGKKGLFKLFPWTDELILKAKGKNAFLVFTTLVVIFAAPIAKAADIASAEIIDTEGTVIGMVTFEETPNGVLVYVEVSGIPPGGHGIHLHAVGSCDPDFKAAGGHINPDHAKHGLKNPEGPDNGDLPNLYAASDGSARAEFFTTRVSVYGNAMPALLDGDGSAVIIHENPDDHMTQPIGGAGGRIGCGIIQPR
ncbi:MAG: superoxide dismutase family protein [Rhodobacteraceae bacterium]|nr:superoxide dismutase family protein [Paracoccaceae bacterium]